MSAGKDRVSEIVDYAILHGDDNACKTFNVSRTTLDRYRRIYKEHFGENADLLLKIKSRYSEDELRALSEGIRPKISKNIEYNFAGEELSFLVMTDTHIGSLYSNEARLYAAFDEGEKQKVNALIHVGDVTEGMSGRPNSVLELNHIGYKAQKLESIRLFSNWKKKAYFISGNHDDFFNTKLGAGISIVEDICKELPDAEFVGEISGDIILKPWNIKINLFHGNDAGSSYALSYRLQKIINGMSPSNKGHILLTGHDHKAFGMFYRNVHAVACGCIQDQTPWMEGKGIQAMTGFYIIKLAVVPNEVRWFQTRFYPFYK